MKSAPLLAKAAFAGLFAGLISVSGSAFAASEANAPATVSNKAPVSGAASVAFKPNEVVAFTFLEPLIVPDVSGGQVQYTARIRTKTEPLCLLKGWLTDIAANTYRDHPADNHAELVASPGARLKCAGWAGWVPVKGHFVPLAGQTGWSPPQSHFCAKSVSNIVRTVIDTLEVEDNCVESSARIETTAIGRWEFLAPVEAKFGDPTRAAR